MWPTEWRSLVLAAFAAACLCPLGACISQKSPKHILFLMIDDLGYNDVSYRNTSDLSSPNIDRLALAGLRLERYYTHNLCSPSRTSFLSGRYASTLSMQGCVIINGHAIDLPKEVSTVADRLSAGGWKTAAFGKWDAGMTTWDYTPTCRGFSYFYGYWNAAQDYYTHGGQNALDLHENFATDYTQAGVYSTNLYTEKAQAWIEKTVGQDKADKSFTYLAYQAMHGPIEAPDHYVNDAFCSQVTTLNKRNIYCGMMACLDEGVGNLTRTYESLSIWEDTLVVLAADNGGHVGSSGNNAPLRGEKSTNFEGGVRAVGFLHWPGLAPELKGAVSNDVVAVADWLPTFVAGVAGLELKQDRFRYPLDGVNQWKALTTTGKVQPARGPTTGLVHEIGGDNGIRQESYMEGNYKIVQFHASIYFNTQYTCVNYSCPTGWNPLPAPGVQPIPPPDRRINGTWLFDVFDDPLEKHDLSEELPEVVTRMAEALSKLSARPGCSWKEQIDCPPDPLANPAKYNNGTVFPWRGAREPSCNAAPLYVPHCLPPPAPPAPPGPPLPGPAEGDVDGIAIGGDSHCSINGWCSGAKFSGPPRDVRARLDGPTVVSNATASIYRPKAGDHGFELSVPCSSFATGTHRFDIECFDPVLNHWASLVHSPLCTNGGERSPC